MKSVLRVIVALIALSWLAGCASAPENAETPVVEETAAETTPAMTDALSQPGIATFKAADGTTFTSETIVTLPTGGPPAGRLLPAGSNPDVTLYVTRDGSVPSADNNWGGAIDPANPRPISRALEGVASYRVVAELDGATSDPFTLTVKWKNEESPDVKAPVFSANGRTLSGSVTIPVSDGSEPAGRLVITCDYAAATLFITRDGSDPTVDNFWKSQVADGTYLFSPEPTAAEYRVIALWQGVTSPVASLNVEWK